MERAECSCGRASCSAGQGSARGDGGLHSPGSPGVQRLPLAWFCQALGAGCSASSEETAGEPSVMSWCLGSRMDPEQRVCSQDSDLGIVLQNES